MEEYRETLKERNSMAQSARRSATAKGSKNLPEITRKEWEQKNGEIKSYNLNAPMRFKEFGLLPDEIQREYINGLVAKYNATSYQVAAMLGTSQTTMSSRARRCGARWSNRKPTLKEKAAFAVFTAQKAAETNCPVEAEIIPPKEEKPVEKATEPPQAKIDAVIKGGTLTIEGTGGAVCETLYKVIGNGRVHLNATWDAINE